MQPLIPVRKCAHPECQCLVNDHAEYCSQYCKLTATYDYCGCSHTRCNTGFAQYELSHERCNWQLWPTMSNPTGPRRRH